jgi:malonyl-CoA/methylmalonyl-CoA synthetase
MAGNLYTRLRAVAPPGDTCCLRLPDGSTLDYAALDARSAQYAGALLGLGVEPGDRVAVQADKGVELLLLYLGCLRAGAVYLPLNTAYTPAELEYFIADATPRIFVCAPQKLSTLLPLARRLSVPHVVTLGAGPGEGSLAERAATQPTDFVDVAREGTDLAAIVYTSGTTGRSKGAMITHGNVASNAFALKAAWRFTRADVLLHVLPLFHIHGLFIALHPVLAAGASMHLQPAFDPAAVLRLLPHSTVFMGVPTHYVRLLGEPALDAQLVRGLRLFASGSAPLGAETHRAFAARTGHRIIERYGMSEAQVIASNPYDGERQPGSVGMALPGVQVRIADAQTGTPLPAGEVGMIEVRGPNVFAGYWRMPDKTRAEFRADGFFVTGDLGVMDGQGRVRIVGRGRDLVISGGFNVYPREVEIVLESHPAVEEVAVAGVPSEAWGEEVTAFVVPSKTHSLVAEELIAFARERLATYKCPRRVVVVESLPRNAMGKVERAKLIPTNSEASP